MANGSRDEIQVNLTELQQSLDAGIAGADKARAKELERLQQVRRVTAAADLSEHQRLVSKYGPDHSKVAALAERIEVNVQVRQNLQLEFERASMPVPKTDPDAWQLLGHVRNRDRVGVPDLTVSLYDDKGAWIRPAGYSCTDKTGSFTLSIKRDKPAPPKPVFIHVADRRKTVLFRDTQPTIPGFGEVTYREIILAESPPCLPPEDSDQPKPGPRAAAKEPPAKVSPAKG
jgi:hypothetical protein